MESSHRQKHLTSFPNRCRNFILAEPRSVFYGVMFLLSVGFFGWWVAGGFALPAAKPIPQPALKVAPALVDDELAMRHRRAAFFESQVLSTLESVDESNRAAATRCLHRIKKNFEGYRSGVDAFVNDITGIKSRFGILKRMPGGWWSSDDRVSQYVAEKFSTHLFSEETLTEDLRISLEIFREDVRANQRELLTRTQAAISQFDLPPLRLDDYETFFSVVNQQINELAGDEAKTSVTDGLVALIVSETGATAVGMVAGRFVAGLTASSATAVATAGGATAGGAAAGAAGGSMVPGPGTIAGFAVGLVVGLGIDYWMNQQTAAALREELVAYIDRIESDLLNGSSSDASNSGVQPGIASGIDLACERLRDGVHQRLFDLIVLEQSL